MVQTRGDLCEYLKGPKELRPKEEKTGSLRETHHKDTPWPWARLNSMTWMPKEGGGSVSSLKLVLNFLTSSFPAFVWVLEKKLCAKKSTLSLGAFLFFRGRGF